MANGAFQIQSVKLETFILASTLTGESRFANEERPGGNGVLPHPVFSKRLLAGSNS